MIKKNTPIFLFILLLAGLFWSRALLSIVQGIWALYAIGQLIHSKSFNFKDPIFIWSLAPLCCWTLGAFQHPLAMANFDYALTLAVYPATVLVVKTIPKKIINKQLVYSWLAATAIGLVLPIYWYVNHQISAHNLLGSGQALPTFMDTDHVRFSILLCSNVLLLLSASFITKKMRFALVLLLTILILFLAVRTGWVLLFFIIIAYCLLIVVEKKSIKPFQVVALIFIVVLLASAAYYLFPTVQQKIAYTIYDWQQFQPGKFNANYSDGTRRAINYAAIKSIESGEGSNIGWSSIPAILNQSLAHYFSGVNTNFGWPFNQWLFWWMGSGWWGALLFSAWLFYPAIVGFKQKNKGIIIWTIAIAISCLAEATLNYQYGVFLHVWPLVILWQKETILAPDNS
jgi:hypothetical protein